MNETLTDRFREWSRQRETAGRTPQGHLIGMRGSGMRSLARYLQAQGWQITGSDLHLPAQEQTDWAGEGLRLFAGHAGQQVPSGADLVIRSLAIPDENPEWQRALELEAWTCSYAEALGALTRLQQTLGVAGTHGKTTTCCLLSHVLRSVGMPADSICGGQILPNRMQPLDLSVASESAPSSARNRWLIAECCEFRGSFLKLAPQYAALLAVEPDHFDCFPDEASLLAGFEGFCGTLPAQGGGLLVNADSPLAVRAAQQARCSVEYYRLEPQATDRQHNPASAVQAGAVELNGPLWQVVEIHHRPAGTTFQLITPDEMGSASRAIEIGSPLVGRHQVANTVAALWLAERATGRSFEEISAGLTDFPGVRRRFQSRGEYRGWSLWDDYAHHPTEIRATLAAARVKFGARPLIVAFQPHQMLRTERLLGEFAEALSLADRVYVLPIFAAREQADERMVGLVQELVRQGNSRRCPFEWMPSLDHLRSMLDDTPRTGVGAGPPVFLALGAGDIDRIFYELPG